METVKEKPMTEAEYRAYPAINFSSLAAYYNKGTYSPDHALMEIEYKSYFEYGKMFETMLQDAAKGTDEFSERFFKSTVSGKMPDGMIKWIDEGEDLETHIRKNKDGSRNKQSTTLHAFIDEAMANPGKIPVSTQDWAMLERHTENMLKMHYQDALVEDILRAADWQVPITWLDRFSGLEKKALVDFMVDLGKEFFVGDIKTTANFKQFSYMLSDKYFIQDLHYCEGVNATTDGSVAMQMVFFVASKESPFLCQPWGVDYGGVDFRMNALQEYEELCNSYAAWVESGKPPKGWLPFSSKKVFFSH